jgi:hypothetical protein
MGVYKTVLAHSGAVIGAARSDPRRGLNGEIPNSWPNLFEQVDLFDDATRRVNGDRESVTLVLMDGGINDVNVRTILNPFACSEDELIAQIDDACEAGMTKLLRRVVDRFPNARVVVTGYFQIVSSDSDLLALTAFLIATGVIIGGGFAGTVGAGGVIATGCVSVAQRDDVEARSTRFDSRSRGMLGSAVRAVNEELGEERIVHVDPRFDYKNAACASETLLFGVTIDGTAQDNVREAREAACERDVSDSVDNFMCDLASVGHPTEKGAKQYAKWIIDKMPVLV